MAWVYDVPPEVAAISNWREIVGLSLASTILMVIVCLVRWWTKRKAIGSEDWLIFIALWCNIVYAAFTIIQTRYGLGLPIALRAKNLHQKFILYNYVSRGPNIVAVAVSKIALCITCHKMLHGTDFRKFRWFIVGLAVFTGAFWTALCVIEIFNCRPFMKVLDASIHGTCLPYGPPVYSIWIINIFDDVLVYLLPVPLILRLNLQRAVKVGLTISFALGLFTTVFSILKITQVARIVSGDHNSSLLVLYTTLEGNVGTMSASWPTLRVLVMRLPGLRNLSTSSRKASKSSQSYRMTDSTRSGSVPNAKKAEVSVDEDRSEIGLVDEAAVAPWDGGGILKTVQYEFDSINEAERSHNRNNSWG